MTNHEELNNKFAAALMKQTEINDQIRQLAFDSGAVADRFDEGDLYFENNLQFFMFVSKLTQTLNFDLSALQQLVEMTFVKTREECAKVADGFIGGDVIAEKIRALGV